MKKIMIVSGVLALMMAAATSCDEYDIYPEQYGDVMMIKDAGEKEITIYATDDAAEYYVSVMKGGHNPESESQAVLRVMTPDDFKAYKTRMYGDPDFPGLDFLNPDFYEITDANGNPIDGTTLTYNFSGNDDRYFGLKILLNAQKISDWRAEMESTPEGVETLNRTNFVVPVGLYSATDSVNADNQAVMIHPVVTNPVLQVDVENNAYHVTEISRTKLLNDEAFRQEHILPEVYLSIPCKNPYGFKVLFTTESDYVSDFNSSQTKVSLSNLRNSPKTLYQVGVPKEDDPTKWDKVIEFPAGVTKVRFPIEFFTENIDAEDLSRTWVRGFRFKKAKGGNKGYDMDWPETIPGTDQPIPDKVKYSLTFPTAEDGSAYTFFIGYKVVETPLELSDAIVSSNDCEPTEGSIAALFDNDLSTFFHSGWTVAFDRSAPFGSYLEIDCTGFPDINACYFQFTSRSNANPMSPKEVHLYYSNEMDDATRLENKASWTLMAEKVLKKKLGTSQVGEIGSLANPIVTPDYKPFKFLRFCVVKNSDDQSLFTSSTSIYWNLAELVMYGKLVEPGEVETETPEE